MSNPVRKPRSVWFSDEEWADADEKAKARNHSISALFREFVKRLPKNK